MASKSPPEIATGDERIHAVADAIASHLQRHPRSADTVRGIRQWWLQAVAVNASDAEVEQALSLLEAKGIVESLHAGPQRLWRRRRHS
jgi:hypothetical protein